MDTRHPETGPQATLAEPEPIVFSNSIRLTNKQWLGAGLFIVFLCCIPFMWKRFEKLPFEPAERMPHQLSNDYWLYERYADLAAGHYDTLLLGDSVICGEYVLKNETLAHYLNER